MILAVSIGNTNIRVAMGYTETKHGQRDTTIAAQAVFHASRGDIISNIETRLGHVLDHQIQDQKIWAQIQGSIIASVVPEITDELASALGMKIRKPARRIDRYSCGDLRTDKYTGLLGEDRVVCCARALQKFEPPLVVIDFGTATTVNVVAGDNIFAGGAIMPGLLTGLDALAQNTAQLPQMGRSGDTPWHQSVPLIGTNTAESMASGAVIGLACAVDGFIHRILLEYNLDHMPIIVTGGHAPVVLPYCQFDYIHEPALLLEGLLSL